MQSPPTISLGNNLWVLRHPNRLLGTNMSRNVTLIRLRTGALWIHSTASFSDGEVEAIRQHGQPA